MESAEKNAAAGEAFAFDDAAFLRNNAEELRNARLARGLSRDDLARYADLHANTIATAEGGERDLSGLTVVKLHMALGVDHLVLEQNRQRLVLLDQPFVDPSISGQPDSTKIFSMGETVRSWRKARGLSLEELSRRSGVHRNSLWNFEKGLVIPTITTIQRVYWSIGVREVGADADGVIFR